MATFLTIAGAILGIACLVNLLCLLSGSGDYGRAGRKTKIVWTPVLTVLTIFFWVLFFFSLRAEFENRFYDTYQTVSQLEANIDIMRQREKDLSAELSPLVSKYMDLEKTLIHVVQERNTEKLLALFEKYPDLKSSANFQKLMDQLFLLRDGVARAQLEKAAVVKQYNAMSQTWPSRSFKPSDLPIFLELEVEK